MDPIWGAFSLFQWTRIKNIDVNSHSVVCGYEKWYERLDNSKSHIDAVKRGLGTNFNRFKLVEFYKDDKIGIETKFLAAMIWGHEAPKGSQPDRRGPWKVSEIFSNQEKIKTILEEIRIGNEEQIFAAYQNLGKIHRLGPSFFTKHLYFLGKSYGLAKYPLIFDDRVAAGLMKLFLPEESCINMVDISAKKKGGAYIAYLKLAHEWATDIGCEPDQVEYFLFGL